MTGAYVCGDCGYEPVGSGRPPINTCPQCRGDFTWAPRVREAVAQQLRPYMSDADAEKAVDGVRVALGEGAMSEPCPYSLLHRYTEQGARALLARSRLRGDYSLAIAGCSGTDHWHVYNVEEAAIAGQGPMTVENEEANGE